MRAKNNKAAGVGASAASTASINNIDYSKGPRVIQEYGRYLNEYAEQLNRTRLCPLRRVPPKKNISLFSFQMSGWPIPPPHTDPTTCGTCYPFDCMFWNQFSPESDPCVLIRMGARRE